MFSDVVIDAIQSGLLVKMLCTAFIVIAVSLAVNVFGPIAGGALTGLPIVIGPGFYFLAQQHPVEYVSLAASAAVLAQCASQFFLLAYIIIASKRSPFAALFGAVAVWGLAALVLKQMMLAVPIALIVYGVITIAFRAYGRRFLSTLPPRRSINNFVLIVGRGAIAGLMVALVSTASKWLTPAASGMLLAFPIGYTVLAITIHQTMGPQHAMLMLYTGLFGTVSLAAFAAVFSIAILHWPIHTAMTIGVVVSIVVTLGLLYMRPILTLLLRRTS